VTPEKCLKMHHLSGGIWRFLAPNVLEICIELSVVVIVVVVASRAAVLRADEELCIVGKVVFGEVIAAAVSADGSQYFNKSWRHAAGHVVSPPLRQDTLTGDHLLDLLSKLVNH